MQEWLMTITLGIIGAFLIAVTYAALYQSKKSQKHISGFPFFGGFILAVAFLFSPIKWLAFLGFIDYGLWLLPYVLIMDYYNNKKFKKIYIMVYSADTGTFFYNAVYTSKRNSSIWRKYSYIVQIWGSGFVIWGNESTG